MPKSSLIHITPFLESRYNCVERTVAWYEQQLRPFAQWLAEHRADPLDPISIERYLSAEKRRGRKPRSIAASFRALRVYYRWAQSRGLLANCDPNPISLIIPPKIPISRPRVARLADVMAAIDAIDLDSWVGYRDRAIFTILAHCGLRIAELCALELDQIDHAQRLLWVISGKGSRDRPVPYSAQAAQALTQYLYNRPIAPTDYLFISSTGRRTAQPRPVTVAAVRQMMRRRCAVAGVKYINPHSLRHMYAIKLLNDGVELSAVSAMLGHASPAFTYRHYARWAAEGLRRQYEKALFT